LPVAHRLRGAGGLPGRDRAPVLPHLAGADSRRPQGHRVPNAEDVRRRALLAGLPVHPAAADDAALRRGAQHRPAGNAHERVAAGVGGWGHYHLDEQRLLTVPASIDPMPVVASYLGLALAGAMFLALGLLVSSLVRSQMVAALITLILGLGFIVAGFWRPDMDTSSLV